MFSGTQSNRLKYTALKEMSPASLEAANFILEHIQELKSLFIGGDYILCLHGNGMQWGPFSWIWNIIIKPIKLPSMAVTRYTRTKSLSKLLTMSLIPVSREIMSQWQSSGFFCYTDASHFSPSKGPVGFPGDPGPPGEPGVAVSMKSSSNVCPTYTVYHIGRRTC